MNKKQYQILLRLNEEYMEMLNDLSRERQVSRQSVIKALIKKEAQK